MSTSPVDVLLDIAQYADYQYTCQRSSTVPAITENSVKDNNDMPGHLARRFQQIAVAVFLAEVGEAGFDLKIRVTEFATSLKQAEAGEYQAFMLAWSGRIDPDGNSYIFLKTGAPQNYSAWSNAEADKTLDAARLVTDQTQRKALYEKLTGIVQDEEPILYLYHRRILIAHTTRLEGYKQMPDGLVRVTGLRLK